jgi:hypothetical protein
MIEKNSRYAKAVPSTPRKITQPIVSQPGKVLVVIG